MEFNKPLNPVAPANPVPATPSNLGAAMQANVDAQAQDAGMQEPQGESLPMQDSAPQHQETDILVEEATNNLLDQMSDMANDRPTISQVKEVNPEMGEACFEVEMRVPVETTDAKGELKSVLRPVPMYILIDTPDFDGESAEKEVKDFAMQIAMETMLQKTRGALKKELGHDYGESQVFSLSALLKRVGADDIRRGLINSVAWRTAPTASQIAEIALMKCQAGEMDEATADLLINRIPSLFTGRLKAKEQSITKIKLAERFPDFNLSASEVNKIGTALSWIGKYASGKKAGAVPKKLIYVNIALFLLSIGEDAYVKARAAQVEKGDENKVAEADAMIKALTLSQCMGDRLKSIAKEAELKAIAAAMKKQEAAPAVSVTSDGLGAEL